MLALAAIYEGATRTEASRIGGVTLQIVRDWALKFNARGPDCLIDRKAPGQPSLLKDEHRAALARIVEDGPTPAIHGVVRWRLIDLAQWVFEEFRLSIAVQTLSRELRKMGYRKLSARPRHHAQAEGAIEDFKKVSRRAWTKSRAKAASASTREKFGSKTKRASVKRTKSPVDGRSADRGPARRKISAPPRPISSAPSAPSKARARRSSCPPATPSR